MPISASAKKALRVAKTQATVNRHRKNLIKTAIKNVSAENINQAMSAIDKAAKWGIFHSNKAARLKSQLAKQFGAGLAKPTKKAETKTATPAKAKAAPKAKAPVAKKPAAKKTPKE